ncbi:hypothetical protein [Aquimarina sp. 2201CG5-10]|uniref:hypothetical protein n=1 Tax=Aquimarina callyspongiae TaxID=3098150 RepID=UPI002AB5452D|nr:hypothetical protein [Aquimarina sp. 2201CG5-10]MDY8134150.1 hypothetical protein [Aquimarina sp. 2201CG5-10]
MNYVRIKQFLFLTVFSFYFGISQTKKITVIDSHTNLPIEGVHTFYASLQEGSYTNEDGVVDVILKDELLTISHLNYQELTLTLQEIKSSNTLYLKPVDVGLDEVIVNSFNLKKALQYVLENYYNLYVSYSTEKECSFKEKLIVDGEIHRLILSELKLWTKDAALNNRKLDKTTKLKLGAISHNKNVPLAFDINNDGIANPEASGHIITKSLLANSYLDVAIGGFLKHAGHIEETIENSSSDVIVVSYTTDWKNFNKVANRTKGKIVFDKKTKAVIEFVKEIELRNDILSKTSDFSGKEYQYETKKQLIRHTFAKGPNGKYSLSRFSIDADVLLSFENKKYSTQFKNDLFVLKETKKRKVDKQGIIDLDKAIYKALPSNIINTNTVVLTLEEKAFLKTKIKK